MKKLFYLCLTFAIVALSACSDDEQSSLNFDDIQGKAVIKGVVTYNPGYLADGGEVVKKSVPAGGAVVTVEVNNSEYVATSEGTKTYQATANEKGEYTIEIPVGIKNVNAIVSVREFDGSYSEYVNKSLLTISGVTYGTMTTEIVSLKEGGAVTKNLSLGIKDKPAVESRGLNTSVKGMVQVKAEEFVTNMSGEHTGLKSKTVAMANAKVAVTFVNVASDSRELRYETTTTNTGEFAVNAALFDNWNLGATEIKLEILGQKSEIKHWYCEYNTKGYTWHSQNVEVYYSSVVAKGTLAAMNNVVPYDFGEYVLDFSVLTDKDNIRGIGGKADVDEDGNPLYFRNDPLNLYYK